MKQFSHIFKYFLFWLFVFTIERITFFIYHAEKISRTSKIDKLKAFIYGSRLDLSISSYIILVPLLLLIINLFYSNKNRLNKFINSYTVVLFILISILGVIDLSIYSEWGSKLNSRAIEFLIFSPGEALASSASSPVLQSTFIAIGKIIVYLLLYYRIFKYQHIEINKIWKESIAIIIYFLISIIMLRGGLQLAPINQSSVYYSNNLALNHTALNTTWNLMHSVLENHFSTKNPYIRMSDQEAKSIIDSLYQHKNKNEKFDTILKSERPNIVFIVLESFTSDVVQAFGGAKGVSNEISKLTNEGLAFQNIYASGDRTDKGMIAIMSGFPTQAVRSIMSQPEKFEKLPSITKTLKSHQYTTAFYYGGESEFANFRSYLMSASVDRIVDKRDFRKEQMNSKWGAHDGYLFDKALKDLGTLKEPFMGTILTLSSHEPFEVPIETPFKGKDLPSQFKKAAYYTDQCVGKFIRDAQKEPWYKNTLFIIVADHGHRLPREYRTAYYTRKYRIPLIFYGEVLNENYQHKKIDKIGSQTDIASTLLKQLNISDTAYKWSNNLLDLNSHPFAFYTYDDGFGWIDDDVKICLDNVSQRVLFINSNDLTKSKKKKIGQAYLQEVFNEYLSY